MKVFEERAEKLIEKYQIPGTAVGIAQNGEVVYEKGFGYRNIAEDLPVTMDSIFGIASVSKSFICVAIMQLQEAGKLSVHDSIVNHLPNFKTKTNATEKMTIHHLMTHTAGFPPLPTLLYANKESIAKDPSAKDYRGVDFKKMQDGEPLDTYEQLVDFIADLEFDLLGEPGTEFSYSNDSYALLGAIVSEVSGETYEDYLQAHIFDPIGMKNTFVDYDRFGESELITELYASKKEDGKEIVYEAPYRWKLTAMKASGSIKSSIEDMLKYAEVFRTKGKYRDVQILTEASVEAMITPYIEIVPGQFYGYGLRVIPDYYGGTFIEHGGNSKAVASQMCIIPERGVTGMILTNLAGVPAPTILQGAVHVYEGRDFNTLALPTDKVKYTAVELEEFTGEYVSAEGMKLTVALSEDQLTFDVAAIDEPVTVKNLATDLFLAIINDQTEVIRFVRDESGKIEKVGYHLRQFPKVK